MDWRTPLGRTTVVGKERNPTWRPPPSIRREHEIAGEELPEVIPGGATDNPLGLFALRLGFKSYLIHGVDESKQYGIGMRVTHGCIRMYPEDIEALFNQVQVGTPVLIINEPIKLGRRRDAYYLEVHQPLEEDEDEVFAPEDIQPVLLSQRITSEEALTFVHQRLAKEIPIDESLIAAITERGDGIPVQIGKIW